MTLVAGVDVGGTKIAACLIDPLTGVVSASERIPSRAVLGGSTVLADCGELVRRVQGANRIEAVGIGLCEFVSRDGRPTSGYTIDWRGLDVAGAFGQIAPVVIESDVRAGALAEARFGVARGLDDPWLYVSIGTGVSYSLVIGGRPYTGVHGNAIVVGAPPVELTSSGLALQRQTGHSSAETVLADPALSPLVADAAAALGRSLAALANALDPALIVFAGGLGLIGPYRDAIVERMREDIMTEATRAVPVVVASLGALAGSVGAALAAASAFG